MWKFTFRRGDLLGFLVLLAALICLAAVLQPVIFQDVRGWTIQQGKVVCPRCGAPAETIDLCRRCGWRMESSADKVHAGAK